MGLLYNRSQMSKTTASNGHGTGSTIAVNKKARHDFFIEERLEAGIALEGWEVKALRAGRVQLVDSYVIIKNGEAWLLGALITALPTVSTHYVPEAQRTRKLLLHRRELDRLIGAVERKGYAIIALALYWKHGRCKVELGLAKGKQAHDKRASERDRDWQREKGRIMKHAR
jgi:SsrA-binding protein